jgi:hypothetical protein
MKTKHFIFIGIAIVLLLAIITNPNVDDHKEKVKSKIHAHLQESIAKDINKPDTDWAKAGELFGNMFGEVMVNNIVNTMVTTNNYIFFSTTNISLEGKTKTIGLGVFGNVFLSNKVNEALENSSKESNASI